jgi:nitrate/nitrite transporter NarK
MYFAFSYGLYLYFTWLPTFLIKELGLSAGASRVLASLPFVLAGIADLAGGWLTDYLSRTRGLRVGRCYLGFASFFTCGALVFASTLPVPPIAKAVLLAFALASADLALGACWAVPIDIAPDHAGVITGCMNTLGNLGGLLGPLVVGVAVDRWGSWTIPFYVTAAVYAAGRSLARDRSHPADCDDKKKPPRTRRSQRKRYLTISALCPRSPRSPRFLLRRVTASP